MLSRAVIDADHFQLLTAVIGILLGGGLVQALARWRQMPADRSVAWVTAQDVVIENLGLELKRRDDELRELRVQLRDALRRIHELEVKLDENGQEFYG